MSPSQQQKVAVKRWFGPESVTLIQNQTNIKLPVRYRCKDSHAMSSDASSRWQSQINLPQPVYQHPLASYQHIFYVYAPIL